MEAGKAAAAAVEMLRHAAGDRFNNSVPAKPLRSA